MAAFAVLSFQSCEKWGLLDPPAGTDNSPRLEQVAKITFEDGAFDPGSIDYYAYEGGAQPTVVDDESGGKALHLAGGYARMANPVAGAQNGVSLIFLAKQVAPTDEEGNALPPDTAGALFSFQNANNSQRMWVTADGRLVYRGVDGDYDSGEVKTGMLLDPGVWHYVALTVRDDGYSVYVDGYERIDRTVPTSKFDFGKVVGFMGDAPYIYIGYGADVDTKEMWIDDFTIYRNQITAAERVDPRVPTEVEVDYRNWLMVGAEDNSSGYYSAVSPLMRLKDNQTLNLSFIVNSAGANNYNFWNLAVSNGEATGTLGGEYFILRADYWENVAGSRNNITADFGDDGWTTADWTAWRADMVGATVDMTVARSGGTITVKATFTSTNGKVYNYGYTYTGNLTEEIVAYLVTDSSHFLIDAEKTVIGQLYAPGSYVVGAADNSSGFFAPKSEFSLIEGDTAANVPFVYNFTNHTDGLQVYNNWILVVTDGTSPTDAGYGAANEYLVIRADAYGWGSIYNAEGETAGYNMDTFTTDMQGAICRVAVERTGGTVKMTAKVRTAKGTVLPDYIVEASGVTTPNIGVFLTLEKAHLDITAVGYLPMWSSIQQ